VQIGLGFFACIAFLWLTEALPLTITALLVPVRGCAFGLMDVKASLAGFADPLIFLFLGGFAMAAALSAQGLDHWLARQIVDAGKGDFMKVSYLLFAATAMIAMWVSNTATTAMMLPLAMGILRRHPSRRNATDLLLGVAYSASIGGIGTIVGSPPNGIAAAKLGIGFTDWMKFGIPAVLVLLPLMVMVLKLMCRPVNLAIPKSPEEKFAFTRPRKVTLAIFLTTAVCWIGSGPLAKLAGIGGSFDTLIALAAVVALETTGVLRWKGIEKGTDWGVLLLFGGGITLSTILGQSGASVFMARNFSGGIADWPPLAVTGALVVFTIFLTEFTRNTALAALMVPIFFSIAGELGLIPDTLILPLAIATSCSFMMPVGTPPNAIVFATGKVPQREMIRAGLFLNLAAAAVLTVLSIWLF
jgi:sodium-dependent dicarboxylate transporter 2/3/5